MTQPILTFNQLLHGGGIEPACVRLVRHKPAHEHHRAIYDAAMNSHETFRLYQEIQTKAQVIAQFRAAKHLAAFVVEPGTSNTLFIGVWDNLGEREPPVTDPFSGPLKSKAAGFKTKVRAEFDEYRGRLIINWGDGERAWVQRAELQEKPIVEIRRVREIPKFPGFTNFSGVLGDVDTVPTTWSEVLSSVGGVYLLVDRETGQQYVGSAYGADGFFGRWKSYADGHGGNVAMKELKKPASSFDVSILEVVAGSDVMSEKKIFERESLWKAKLGTRVKGLNRN